MYEIINIIHEEFPLFDTSKESRLSSYKKCHTVVKKMFDFTDHLDDYFPNISKDTYCMIVCGAIMQLYVTELDLLADIEDSFFDELNSKYADNNTKEYFKKIFYAIDSIRLFNRFDKDREIFDWPIEFYFENIKEDDSNFKEYQRLLLEAIREMPDYSFAYCLLSIPYLNSIDYIGIDFEKVNRELMEAIVHTHKKVGDNLFYYLYTGNFLGGRLVYKSNGLFQPSESSKKDQFFEENYEFALDIDDYVKLKGYDYKTIKEAEIKQGYYNIDGVKYPCGIPFFYDFEYDKYVDFMGEMFKYIPEENNGWYKPMDAPNILTDQGDFRIEICQPALYHGLVFFMPSYSCIGFDTNDAMRRYSTVGILARLLDVSSDEVEKLNSKNQELDAKNKELDTANRKLDEKNRELDKLNRELDDKNKELDDQNEKLNILVDTLQNTIYSLGHSSANVLNSQVLQQAGKALYQAVIEDPTIEELHEKGLVIIEESVNEAYMRNRLMTSELLAKGSTLEYLEQLQKELSKSITDNNVNIIDPFEYSLRTILSRALFRKNEKRFDVVRKRLGRTNEELNTLYKSYIEDILEDSSENKDLVLDWCNNHFCSIELVVSEELKKLRMDKGGNLYNLFATIFMEQLLNAFSHGDIKRNITIELSADCDLCGDMIIWNCINIQCANYIFATGNHGSQTGIKSLNALLEQINIGENECFVGRVESDRYISTAKVFLNWEETIHSEKQEKII